MTVGEHHDLGAFAALGLAHAFAPFFAEENVPSANDSSRLTFPFRSSARTKRAQAFSQMPAWVHSLSRRQQVAGEGKYFGKSFHRAPVRRTHRIPSTHRRGSTRGRPPLEDGGLWGNRSAINCHCSFVSSYSGSILDPAAGTSVPGRDRLRIGELLSYSPIRRQKPKGFT
jgi:hypothetical protein